MALQQKIKVWDPVIRFFHWSMALSFLLNSFVVEEGESAHEWLGYYILGLLLIRLLWGFTGPENARFRDFFPTKRNVSQYFHQLVKGGEHNPDRHNPLGGLMIIAMLLSILITGVSGWVSSLDVFFGADWLEEIHEFFADITLLLVSVHIFAVTTFSWFGKHNLISIMLTGYRKM